MAIYHMVFFKLKSNITPASIAGFKCAVENMVGKVPGLQKASVGVPHPSTAAMSKGFDMGVVAVLDNPETIKVYSAHPTHIEVAKRRVEISGEFLVYDLEFDQ